MRNSGPQESRPRHRPADGADFDVSACILAFAGHTVGNRDSLVFVSPLCCAAKTLPHRAQELNSTNAAENHGRPQKQTLCMYQEPVPPSVVPIEVLDWEHAEKNREDRKHPPPGRRANESPLSDAVPGHKRDSSQNCERQEEQQLRRLVAQLVDTRGEVVWLVSHDIACQGRSSETCCITFPCHCSALAEAPRLMRHPIRSQ